MAPLRPVSGCAPWACAAPFRKVKGGKAPLREEEDEEEDQEEEEPWLPSPPLPSRRRLRHLHFVRREDEAGAPPEAELQRPVVEHVIAAAAGWAAKLRDADRSPGSRSHVDEREACLEHLKPLARFLEAEGVADVVEATNRLSAERWSQPAEPSTGPTSAAAAEALERWHGGVLPALASLTAVCKAGGRAEALAKWSADFLAAAPCRPQPPQAGVLRTLSQLSFGSLHDGYLINLLPSSGRFHPGRSAFGSRHRDQRLETSRSGSTDPFDPEFPPHDEEERHDDLTDDDSREDLVGASFASLSSRPSPTAALSKPEDWDFRRGAREHGWDAADASGVKVRGASYLGSGQKDVGGGALFETACCDLFLVSNMEGLPHISSHPAGAVQTLRRAGEKRFLFVVNWRMPPMQLACVFAAPSWPPDPASASNAEKLLHRFCVGMDDQERRAAFKVIPAVIEGPWLAKTAVGRTPAIIGAKLSVDFFHVPDDYMEVSVDVFSSAAAKSILGLLQGAAKNLVMEVYLVLEGKAEGELPEQILGAFRVSHCDLAKQRGPI